MKFHGSLGIQHYETILGKIFYHQKRPLMTKLKIEEGCDSARINTNSPMQTAETDKQDKMRQWQVLVTLHTNYCTS